ncbi:hypothetical protein DCS32_00670 [Dokdonia sp. Dokd-P16]|uniref:hypothetical protein n=1 Tax=Dokdonia sp. Dokd-P16 TaxID=2173169 RepID=UPI000D545D84|nr:hypothetical protein [Dokdonia sp. Dokd-P16]AWH72735.1 hypothetical protein DCS32_00670 [Dokdonia sp. Dokd-P16]
MKRFYTSIVLLIIITSCSTYTNTIKDVAEINKIHAEDPITSNEVYKIIDTTKLYKLVAHYYKYDEDKVNAVTTYNYKKYLKFYKDGRLAVFDAFDLNSLDTLRAQKTDQGYYDYNYNTLSTRNYITNKNGKQLYNPQYQELAGDTLSLYSQSTKNISHYLSVDIPSHVFVEKANW